MRPTTSDVPAVGRRGLTAFTGAMLLIVLAMLAFSLDRGWDIADESFYWLWTVRPHGYPASIHPFGQPLHLVYLAVGRSFIWLRVAGVVALAASGAWLGASLDRYYRACGVAPDKLGLSLPAVLFSLSYYIQWLLTPSYNLLANVGVALVVAGGLGWAALDRKHRGWGWAPSVMVGAGACVTFFGKPTTAALVAVGVALFLAVSGARWGWGRALSRAVTCAIACAVPLLVIIQLTVTVPGLIDQLRLGLPALNFGNSLLHQPVKLAKDVAHYPPFVVTLAVLAIVLGLRLDGARRLWVQRATIVVLAVDALFLVAMLVRYRDGKVWDASAAGVTTLAFGVLAWQLSRPGAPRGAALLGPVGVLAAAPFVIVLGTANNNMTQTSMSYFGVALAVAVAGRLSLRPALTRVTEGVAALMVVLLLLWAMARPHNMAASAFTQTVPTRVNFLNDTIRLDPLTSAYLTGLQTIARREHLQPSTPIYDVTGGGPATGMALGGTLPFFPWIASSFPNSISLADAVWDAMTPAQRRSAWIVTPVEPTIRPAHAVHEILRAHSRYRLVGELPMQMWNERRMIRIWAPVKARS